MRIRTYVRVLGACLLVGALTTAIRAQTGGPVVLLISPADSATVSGTVQPGFAWMADNGPSRFEFWLDGRLAATIDATKLRGRPPVFTWRTSRRDNGSHTWTIRLYDRLGLSYTPTPLTVQVQN